MVVTREGGGIDLVLEEPGEGGAEEAQGLARPRGALQQRVASCGRGGAGGTGS